MSMGGGRGIHDSGFRFHPWSDHGAAHGTRGNADTRIAAYAFHLPCVRQGVDIQDALLFSKPDGGLDWRPIPFATLQIEILLVSEGGQVWAMHSDAFMLGAVEMCACHSGPGIWILSIQHTTVG